ncbi:HD domain-containing protein [Candidatus Amarobacter glycogenicus]|uniref:HD domain-containing protein n=1 Tax=Candidatus Amarobacter glycogenicus TaxID=3140699 RepID=UPI0031CCCD4E
MTVSDNNQPSPTTLDGLLAMLPKSMAPQDRDLIERAYHVADHSHEGQLRASGESYMYHPLAVAGILAEINLDAATLAAALLHDVVEDTPYTIEMMQRDFGPEVAKLVDGVTKLDKINELRRTHERMADTKAESLRKMFLAMVDDIRVVLIKLADRLHNMRTLGALPEHKRRRIARETLEILHLSPTASASGRSSGNWKIRLSATWNRPPTRPLHRPLINGAGTRTLHWPGGQHVGARNAPDGHQGAYLWTPQTHLQYLAQDEAQGCGLRSDLRCPGRTCGSGRIA